MKLRTKFFLFTIMITVVFSGIRLYDRVSSGGELLLARTVSRSEYLVSFLEEISGDYLEKGDSAKLLQILPAVRNLKQLVSFKLYDSKGRVLYSMVTTGERMGGKQAHSGVAESGDSLIGFKREIERDDKYLGRLEMDVTVEGIAADVENLAWRSVFMSLLSSLVLIAVVWWLTVRLQRGLDNLHHLAANISASELPEIDLAEIEPDIADIAVSLRQLHSRLRAEAGKRKKAEEMKNDFFAMTVHDLKQPVTGLKGAIDLLLPEEERRRLDKDEIKELSRAAQSSVARLNSMISDLLNVDKLSSPDIPLDRDPVALDIFLRQSVEQNSASVISAGKKWGVSIPPETKDCWIYINGELVQRVLGNLVLNAIHYTSAGGHITLGARFLEGGKKIELYVSDEGSGIPEEFRKEIFRKYSSMSTNLANVGLGLAFCAMVAERHSAVIEVKSEPGKGTEIGLVFTVFSKESVPGEPAPFVQNT